MNLTIEKIIKLQEDLKIVASIKQQFEGNQKKMIEKMNKFCLNYYKNKINMKKIFDYCSDANPEKDYEYNLLTTEQAKNAILLKYSLSFFSSEKIKLLLWLFISILYIS